MVANRWLLVLLAAGAAILLAGCNINKYDTYDACQLSDGRYQIEVSIKHDSSEARRPGPPAAYAKLCTELVGGPGVHVDRPAK